MLETKAFGFQRAHEAANELGQLVHKMMCDDKGLVRVAAPGFQAPGVVVVHTSDGGVAAKFIKAGTQIAAGVPFMIGEPDATKTFRIGLFGLDKLQDPARTVLLLTTYNLPRALSAYYYYLLLMTTSGPCAHRWPSTIGT